MILWRRDDISVCFLNNKKMPFLEQRWKNYQREIYSKYRLTTITKGDITIVKGDIKTIDKQLINF
jgi:predicted phosphohydrolase